MLEFQFSQNNFWKSKDCNSVKKQEAFEEFLGKLLSKEIEGVSLKSLHYISVDPLSRPTKFTAHFLPETQKAPIEWSLNTNPAKKLVFILSLVASNINSDIAVYFNDKWIINNISDIALLLNEVKPYTYPVLKCPKALLESILLQAVKSSSVSIVKNIVNLGLDLSQVESPVLIEALEQKNKELFNILIKNGANPNHLSSSASPLIVALQKNNLDAVKLLLDYGANPNLGRSFVISGGVNYRLSALEITTGAITPASVDLDTAKLLISYGATHGGVCYRGLSRVQKQELDKERQSYINAGKEIISNTNTLLNKAKVLSTDQFLEILGFNRSSELYNKLAPKYKEQIDTDVKAVYNYLNSKDPFHFIKSLGGLIYREPSPVKEIHFLIKRIVRLIDIHSKSGSINPQEDYDIEVQSHIAQLLTNTTEKGDIQYKSTKIQEDRNIKAQSNVEKQSPKAQLLINITEKDDIQPKSTKIQEDRNIKAQPKAEEQSSKAQLLIYTQEKVDIESKSGVINLKEDPNIKAQPKAEEQSSKAQLLIYTQEKVDIESKSGVINLKEDPNIKAQPKINIQSDSDEIERDLVKVFLAAIDRSTTPNSTAITPINEITELPGQNNIFSENA